MLGLFALVLAVSFWCEFASLELAIPFGAHSDHKEDTGRRKKGFRVLHLS